MAIIIQSLFAKDFFSFRKPINSCAMYFWKKLAAYFKSHQFQNGKVKIRSNRTK